MGLGVTQRRFVIKQLANESAQEAIANAHFVAVVEDDKIS